MYSDESSLEKQEYKKEEVENIDFQQKSKVIYLLKTVIPFLLVVPHSFYRKREHFSFI